MQPEDFVPQRILSKYKSKQVINCGVFRLMMENVKFDCTFKNSLAKCVSKTLQARVEFNNFFSCLDCGSDS